MQVYLCTDKYKAGIENDDDWNFLISKKSNYILLLLNYYNIVWVFAALSY